MLLTSQSFQFIQSPSLSNKIDQLKMGPSKKITFPQKLWQLVSDRRLESAIRWSDDGQSFFVYESHLRNLCLGKENKIFFTREPKSFIRQLHLYGFRKLNKNQFKHPNFARDRPHLVNDIKRSYKNTNVVQPSTIVEESQTKYSYQTTDFGNMYTSYDVVGVNQQFTPSSISSLCVCPGCCTL
jgi:hypothetical protein